MVLYRLTCHHSLISMIHSYMQECTNWKSVTKDLHDIKKMHNDNQRAINIFSKKYKLGGITAI